jgi:TonB family protein
MQAGGPTVLVAWKPKRASFSLTFSMVLHAAVFAFVVWVGTRIRVGRVTSGLENTVAMQEQAGGPHAMKLLLPKMADMGQIPKVAPQDTRTKTMIPSPAKPKKTMGGEPMNARDGNGTGNAAAGNGSDLENVTPSFPVFSPRPVVPDRALLPATEQRIVVDVDVDQLGSVVREVLVKGIGNKLDQIVLDTVKTWRFQPATKEGKPVPTEAELIFPFGPETRVAAG